MLELILGGKIVDPCALDVQLERVKKSYMVCLAWRILAMAALRSARSAPLLKIFQRIVATASKL